MVAIELQLICFAVVVALNFASSIVEISRVLVPDILHYDSRRIIWPALNFLNVLI